MFVGIMIWNCCTIHAVWGFIYKAGPRALCLKKGTAAEEKETATRTRNNRAAAGCACCVRSVAQATRTDAGQDRPVWTAGRWDLHDGWRVLTGERTAGQAPATRWPPTDFVVTARRNPVPCLVHACLFAPLRAASIDDANAILPRPYS
jgi:hypothetical protein